MLREGGHIHISGICGTAMAAVATLARDIGYRISGSDAAVYPPMSTYLEQQQIPVFQGYAAHNLDPEPDLVIIGNALGRGNPEVERVLDQSLPYSSGARFIGDQILPGRHAIVATGTHGKTSTASLIAHVLEVAALSPGFLIGGIPEDFGTGARLGEGKYFVLEGDEYDTAFFDKRSKFLHYRARTLILNNLEYDHADIFPDLDAIETQFHHLIRTVPANGHIIVNTDDINLARVLEKGCWTPQVHFSERGNGQASWEWEVLKDDGSRFRLWHEARPFLETDWGMLGRHQVSNACAAAAATHALGISAGDIQIAFETFTGIRRRMSLVGEAGGVKIFDDFAHHPTSIAGVIKAMHSRLNNQGNLWVIVEPRSNTMRTKVHEKTLPRCFTGADQVIFVPPSSRNLEPGRVLDIGDICKKIGDHARVLPDVNAIIEHLLAQLKDGDQVLILSNGGFDNIHQRLLQSLTH
ncbi:MAG: UDP-N-acetylmuramate:L-alanyl-gamma-D-glutamyl-meso-diaminopimelate ligase [Mariprofundaceae bacterium]